VQHGAKRPRRPHNFRPKREYRRDEAERYRWNKKPYFSRRTGRETEFRKTGDGRKPDLGISQAADGKAEAG